MCELLVLRVHKAGKQGVEKKAGGREFVTFFETPCFEAE